MKPLSSVTATLLLACSLFHGAHADEALRASIASPDRTPAFAARDVWRHPYETLSFFGIQPDLTVVELSPGGGWYTEILAPYLREKGRLVLAADDPESPKEELAKSRARLQAKLAASPQRFDKVALGVFAPPAQLNYAAPASADLVLTFRNVHNWMDNGDSGVRAVFDSVYRVLKKGGVFGVVEHRLPAGRAQDATSSTGYVHQAYVIRLAQEAGFRLEATSEINANPKDTADHTGGVWALPPSYVNKDVDRDKYQAIGESDRMTLKFVKH
jgi:predicted methyltransferase